jgi:hypothetical protein
MRAFRLKRHVPEEPMILGGETGLGRDSEVLRAVAGPSRISEGRDRVRKRRISWDPPPSPEVIGYRMYWALNQNVSYNSQFIYIGQKTALILPDDVPSFPRVAGQMEIGITALSRSGNESDMCIVKACMDFTRPGMTSNLKIETMKGEGCW